ncbi:hypothetical protein ANCCEY_14081 [Ancylostoma ceylanicum]|uniref:Uncharacterized protein n=1 Tax=Ancylostoma ceylanicum TaxID=53326 RepID=A0A0D6L659_9BILA|nr:hypothetical protein ANCCEY_14081 [Ancylostoma ceylanicum]
MDFVSLVRIIQKSNDDVGEFGNGFVNYHAQHLYVFRKPQQLEELPEYIKTPSLSAACGVNLTERSSKPKHQSLSLTFQ